MSKPIKHLMKKYFGFSTTEVAGLFVLVPVLILILFIPYFLKQNLSETSIEELNQDQQLLYDWYNSSKVKWKSQENKDSFIETNYFNPNSLTAIDWEKKGFKKTVAKRIVSYRLNGSDYKSKKALLKIYGIDKKLLTAYFPYMIMPKRKKTKRNFPKVKKRVRKEENSIGILQIDLITSDEKTLQQIKGIGPVLSKRIVKYRQALGGFQHIEQLNEVYGIDTALYQKIASHITPFKGIINTKNINNDSAKYLANHPYISYKTAWSIINYRKQHGNYTAVVDLKKIYTLSDSLYQKIASYLSVE